MRPQPIHCPGTIVGIARLPLSVKTWCRQHDELKAKYGEKLQSMPGGQQTIYFIPQISVTLQHGIPDADRIGLQGGRTYAVRRLRETHGTKLYEISNDSGKVVEVGLWHVSKTEEGAALTMTVGAPSTESQTAKQFLP
jgi:hypothetical protein